MLKEMGFDGIKKFFDELEDAPNSKFQKVQLYGMLLHSQRIRLAETEVERKIESDHRRILETTIISDTMAIVEAETKINKGTETLYYPVVNGVYVKESFISFDEALVFCLCKKYGQELHAPAMIYNMLRMDLKNEQ
ncbi:hypothetical protein [Paenibacillus medicaginis]|uniref:Uncharacterized protein n=1 Tax=Paenibacillus medicaginis TaxID=1470560 RepID=A0ABV5BV92_9BACL